VSATALPVSRKTSVISLEGESSSADLKALSLAGKDREHETLVSIEHKGENSSSSQLFKGVVAGSSSVKSSVNIHAQKSKSHQLSRFLVVDDAAKTSNRPYLNVLADDVEATHGATTGQLESEAIWYLKSRGLSEKEARSLCIQGFCAEIIKLFSERNFLDQILEEILNA
jgi:Fe-S cluster assembly protein SufD